MTSPLVLPTWRPSGDRLCAALCVVVLSAASGCGTVAYQEKFNAALTEKQHRSDEVRDAYEGNIELQDEPQLISADWPLTLRRPVAFIPVGDQPLALPYVSGDSHRYDGEKIAPQRLHPPFMATADTEIPGFQRCWESLVVGKDGEFTPYYMYVAVVPAVQAAPATEGEADGAAEQAAVVDNSPADEIRARLTAGLGVDPGDWEEIECMQGEWDNDPAVTLTWKRLSVEAEQEFLIYKSEQEPVVADTLPGRFDVCLYEGAKYHVIIAWRVPLDRGVEEDFDLEKVQRACLGTLKGAD